MKNFTSDIASFSQPASHIDKYSFPISADALGSDKQSKSSLTISGPESPNTPQAKQSGVNDEYFLGIRLLQFAPFSNNSLTILISPAATAKHRAGYGIEDSEGSAPRLRSNSITSLISFSLN
jgi:hypothetical protein